MTAQQLAYQREVCESVARAEPLVIIMRGLPGSGKSHWVSTLCAKLEVHSAQRLRDSGIFSTDHFFVRDGQYCFDARRLAEYHQRNLAGFIDALARREPLVICDNTNLAHWEFIAYEAAARALGYGILRVLMGDPSEPAHQALCAARNRHGVPLLAIQNMARVFEH